MFRLTISHIENLLKQFRPLFQFEDYIKSRDQELYVAKQIEALSFDTLKCEFTGLGAGEALKVEDWEYDPTRPLDITVVRKGKGIAVIEVQADYKYTYVQSKFFPIQAHKIMQAKTNPLPHYFVYILTLESKCYWLPTETIEKYEAKDMWTNVKGQWVQQKQHPVPKRLWNKGLKSLVKQLCD